MSSYYRLTSAQLAIWFAQKMEQETNAYNIGEYIEISGIIDPVLFGTAVRGVLDQWDTLHFRFVELDDGPRQYFARDPHWKMPYFDFSDAADSLATAKAWMHDDMGRANDLIDGPLYTFVLFKIRSDCFLYYQRAHHIITDGFTAALFARNLAAYYSSLLEAKSPEVQTSGSWLDALADEESYRNSARYERDRAYWLAQLQDRPAPVTLSGMPPDPIPCRRFIRVTGYLAHPVAEALRSLGAEQG
ncbi:MAG: condensation domain-containing protein, partial [Methylococcaceae bacterium]|nr:condensation domain-containing protein [Methylococcaceae bacterium]